MNVRGITSGENINDVWSERFQNIAKKTKNITIIDRYFITNLYEDINERVTAIERFIDFLSRSNRKFSITIFSEGDHRNSEMHNTISTYFNVTLPRRPNYNGTISRLEVISCRDSTFRDKAHHRYIDFDDFTIELDKGMDIFRSYPLSACSFKLYRGFQNPVFQEAYSALNRHPLWRNSLP